MELEPRRKYWFLGLPAAKTKIGKVVIKDPGLAYEVTRADKNTDWSSVPKENKSFWVQCKLGMDFKDAQLYTAKLVFAPKFRASVVCTDCKLLGIEWDNLSISLDMDPWSFSTQASVTMTK